MQLGLLKSLHSKDFYEATKLRVSDTFFGSDELKIKHVIDETMLEHKRDLTETEVSAIFFANHPSLTTSDKNNYTDMFMRIKKEQPMGEDVIQGVLTKMWRAVVGEKAAEIGFSLINGETLDMNSLRRLLEDHTDNFLPQLRVEFEDLSLDALLQKVTDETKWKFNLPSLSKRVAGVNGGHLIVGGARPNVGKTSFHASMVAGPGGFAHQGANCLVLLNEEATHRVAIRYLTACTGMTTNDIRSNMKKAGEAFEPIRDNLKMVDASSWDMNRVESLCKSYKPDILVIDMLDKIKVSGAFSRSDERLREVYKSSRDIAKEWDCAVFGFSQLSAEAEGKTVLTQDMLEGSRTGKAAEADLMLLIGKQPPSGEQSDEDPWRYLNIAKNKLTGWHGYEAVQLNGQTARYETA
tara:strand:+ start:2842 stop:4065 length:1224 start_codon:yes stop_codon:yes gene_type:complete